MTDLALDCSACGKKFRISFAVKPKQVACPQCKAKVNTSAEQAPAGAGPAGDAATSQKTDASVPATAAASAATGAKPQPKRRLPALLKPEDVEFKGWTYDREAEQARGGLQKVDVMGVLWIGGVLLMIGLIFFNLAKRLHWSPTALHLTVGLMALGGLGLLAAGHLFLKLKKKPDGSTCMQCRGALGLLHTIPSEQDCRTNQYTRGASGHAYRQENGPPQKIWEIRKKWHVCKACKRYFLAERESLDFVGAAKTDMEKRESLYAEAAAAAADPTPQPAPVAGDPPKPAAAPAVETKPAAAPAVEGKPAASTPGPKAV